MKTPSLIAKCNGNNRDFTFSTRVCTAVEMLDLELMMDSREETRGTWDMFMEDMAERMNALDVNFDIRPEYFKGINDVIFELRVHMHAGQDCKVDLDSEQVAGTMLSGICKHFEWTGWNTPRLTDDFDTKRFAHLDAFNER